MSVKLPCMKCELSNNSNGLFTCNGCRQNFCSEHLKDHTNDLRNRFEEITDRFNRINEMFLQAKEKSSDTNWEIIREQGKEINEIKLQMNECEKTSNYSEQELDQWIKRLDKLEIELTKTDQSPTFVYELKRLLNAKEFQLYVISILIILIAYYINSMFKSNLTFTQVSGPIELSKDKRIAEHIGQDYVSGSVRLSQNYSNGIHYVYLLFEKFSISNNFITLISLNNKQSTSSPLNSLNNAIQRIREILRKIWSFFNNNQPRHDFRREIQPGDIIIMKIDCINMELVFENKRTKKIYELDTEEIPLPWQIIIVFDRRGDRVHLL